MFFLNGSYALEGSSMVAFGNINEVELDLKNIIAKAMEYKSEKLILAHTHPHGVLMASAADVATTRRIATALNSIGLELLDHIIVNEEGAASMRTARLLPDIWK